MTTWTDAVTAAALAVCSVLAVAWLAQGEWQAAAPHLAAVPVLLMVRDRWAT